MSKSAWRAVFRLARDLGALFALLWTILLIIDWIRPSPNQPVVDLRFGEFRIPDIVYEDLERIGKISLADIDRQETSGAKDPSASTTDEHVDSDPSTINELHDVTSRLQRTLLPWYDLNGYFSATVVNEGSTELMNVALDLPEVVFARVSRKGGTTEFHDVGAPLLVGTMRPLERIEVYAWTRFPHIDYTAAKATVTHSNGVGRIRLAVPVSGLGRLVDKYAPAFAWMFLACAPVLVLLLISIHKRTMQSRQNAVNSDTDKECETTLQSMDAPAINAHENAVDELASDKQ